MTVSLSYFLLVSAYFIKYCSVILESIEFWKRESHHEAKRVSVLWMQISTACGAAK